MKLEQYLKQIREEKGITQKELAHACRFEQAQSISNIERGNCKLPEHHFATFSRLLGVPLDTMIEIRTNDYRAELTKTLVKKSK